MATGWGAAAGSGGQGIAGHRRAGGHRAGGQAGRRAAGRRQTGRLADRPTLQWPAVADGGRPVSRLAVLGRPAGQSTRPCTGSPPSAGLPVQVAGPGVSPQRAPGVPAACPLACWPSDGARHVANQRRGADGGSSPVGQRASHGRQLSGHGLRRRPWPAPGLRRLPCAQHAAVDVEPPVEPLQSPPGARALCDVRRFFPVALPSRRPRSGRPGVLAPGSSVTFGARPAATPYAKPPPPSPSPRPSAWTSPAGDDAGRGATRTRPRRQANALETTYLPWPAGGRGQWLVSQHPPARPLAPHPPLTRRQFAIWPAASPYHALPSRYALRSLARRPAARGRASRPRRLPRKLLCLPDGEDAPRRVPHAWRGVG